MDAGALAAGVLPACLKLPVTGDHCPHPTPDESKSPILGVLTAAEQYEPAQAAAGKMRAMTIGSAVWRAASASSKPTRLFSTSAAREATWGFVGLGAMGKLGESLVSAIGCNFFPGYPMAKNLRAKIPNTDTLIICDTNPGATKKFVGEVGIAASSADAPGKGTGIHIADNPKDVAQKAVSPPSFPTLLAAFPDELCSISDLSWGLPFGFSFSDYTIFYSQSSDDSLSQLLRLFNVYGTQILTYSTRTRSLQYFQNPSM